MLKYVVEVCLNKFADAWCLYSFDLYDSEKEAKEKLHEALTNPNFKPKPETARIREVNV